MSIWGWILVGVLLFIIGGLLYGANCACKEFVGIVDALSGGALGKETKRRWWHR